MGGAPSVKVLRGTCHALFASPPTISSFTYENSELLAEWRTRVELLVALLGVGLERPGVSASVEDYVIYEIESWEPPGAQTPFRGREQELAQILRCERERLSDQEVTDALSHSISFKPDDLALVAPTASTPAPGLAGGRAAGRAPRAGGRGAAAETNPGPLTGGEAHGPPRAAARRRGRGFDRRGAGKLARERVRSARGHGGRRRRWRRGRGPGGSRGGGDRRHRHRAGPRPRRRSRGRLWWRS